MRRPPSVTSPRARLCLVALERRDVPSAVPFLDDVTPTVMAGRPGGLQPDAPVKRIDPNSSDSPFAGVGSLIVNSRGTPFVGTATAIDRWHIVTAAHVLDVNGDGKFNRQDRTTGVFFNLNLGGDRTHRIAVADVFLHPDFTGFNTPAVNDDIAVLKLAKALPDGVPTYGLPTGGITLGSVITIVGYGRSGTGVGGYSTPSNAAVKRVGQNTVDGFYGQDDAHRGPANEVYRFDFDGPTGDGPLGGNTLGNDVESQLAPGDSGGPAFVLGDFGYVLVGVNTFVQGANAPRFGSMGGGVSIHPALGFITDVTERGPSGGLPGGGESEDVPDPNPPGGDPNAPPPAIDVGARAIRDLLSPVRTPAYVAPTPVAQPAIASTVERLLAESNGKILFLPFTPPDLVWRPAPAVVQATAVVEALTLESFDLTA